MSSGEALKYLDITYSRIMDSMSKANESPFEALVAKFGEESVTEKSLEFFEGEDVAITEEIIVPAADEMFWGTTRTKLQVTLKDLAPGFLTEVYNLGKSPIDRQYTFDFLNNHFFHVRSRIQQVGLSIFPMPLHMQQDPRLMAKLLASEAVEMDAMVINYSSRPHEVPRDAKVGQFFRVTPPLKGYALWEYITNNKDFMLNGEYGNDYVLVDSEDNPMVDMDALDREPVAIRILTTGKYQTIAASDEPIRLDMEGNPREAVARHLTDLADIDNFEQGYVLARTKGIKIGQDHNLVIRTGYGAGFPHLLSPVISRGSEWPDSQGIAQEHYSYGHPLIDGFIISGTYYVCPQQADNVPVIFFH